MSEVGGREKERDTPVRLICLINL